MGEVRGDRHGEDAEAELLRHLYGDGRWKT